MVDDIFHAVFHFEDPSGHSSVSLYYEQTADNGTANQDNIKLAEALEAQLGPLILPVLSDDFWFTSIVVRTVYDNPQAKCLRTVNTQQGTGSGPGLPSNCCINFQLTQGSFPVKSNGRIFFPGIPEVSSETGLLASAYQAGVCTDLAVGIGTDITAIADTGVWRPSVISQKVLNAAPPAKDWSGAVAPITSVAPKPTIAIQRRRTTRVVGGAV